VAMQVDMTLVEEDLIVFKNVLLKNNKNNR
jgi:hypothetical protein